MAKKKKAAATPAKPAAPKKTAAPKTATPKKPAAKKAAPKKADRTTFVKVRATRMGYYDHLRRRVGDVFLIPAWMFSDKWMELADPGERGIVTDSQASLKREHDTILNLKYGDGGTPGLTADPIGDE